MRILESAIDLFGAGGFADTFSTAIAGTAGVTTSTMYHHFTNKRRLYVAAFQRSVDVAWTAYGEAASSMGSSLFEELTAVVDAAAEMMQRRPTMAMLAIRAAIDLDHDEVDRTIPDEVIRTMTTRAVARGELENEDARRVDPLVKMVLWGVSVVGVRGDTDWQRECAETIGLALHNRLVQPRR